MFRSNTSLVSSGPAFDGFLGLHPLPPLDPPESDWNRSPLEMALLTNGVAEPSGLNSSRFKGVPGAMIRPPQVRSVGTRSFARTRRGSSPVRVQDRAFVGEPVPVHFIVNTLFVIQVAGEDEMGVFAQVGSPGELRFAVGVVGAAGDTALDIEFQPVNWVSRMKLATPGDGVRAVNGRSAACDHIHALDCGGRKVGDIDGTDLGTGHHPASVQEGECSIRSQAAQVDILALGGGDVTAVTVGGVDVVQEGRHFRQRVCDCRGSELVQVVTRDDRHRCGRGQSGLDADARAGDGDFAHFAGFGGFLRRL